MGFFFPQFFERLEEDLGFVWDFGVPGLARRSPAPGDLARRGRVALDRGVTLRGPLVFFLGGWPFAVPWSFWGVALRGPLVFNCPVGFRGVRPQHSEPHRLL